MGEGEERRGSRPESEEGEPGGDPDARIAGDGRARCPRPRWDAGYPARGSPGPHGGKGGRGDGRGASGTAAGACSQLLHRGRRHLQEDEGDILRLNGPKQEGWIGLDEIMETVATALNLVR